MNFNKLMLSALLVLSTTLQAQDQIGWGNNPGSNPGRSPWDNNRPTDPRNPRNPREPSNPRDPRDQIDPWEDRHDRDESREVELQVNAYFQGQARLDLIRDSYVRTQLLGKKIREIKITASTEQGNGVARLLVNGQASDMGQTIARQMQEYTFRVDPFANSIGESLRALELEMRGKFYVEKVVFNMLQNNGPVGPGPGYPGQPQTEIVRQQLNETIQGEGGLNLFRTFGLPADKMGLGLRRVTILARSQRGSAQAQIHINDQSNGAAQLIGMSSTRLSFELSGQRIGQEIQALRLYVRGSAVIEEVSLEFDRFGGGNGGGGFPGPGMERRIEQVVNQRLYETNGVNLTALMRIDRRQEDRIVDSVELVLRNSDYGARVKLCQTVQGQYQTVNCGNITTLYPGVQSIRLTSVNFAKLSELSLSVRMGMIDIERIIINLR